MSAVASDDGMNFHERYLCQIERRLEEIIEAQRAHNEGLNELREEVAGIKVKVGLWGGLAGLASGFAAAIVAVLGLRH